MKYLIQSYDKQSEWFLDIVDLNNTAWPKFVQGEKVMRSYWGFLLSNFSKYQIVLTIDKSIVAVANSAPFRLGTDINNLSDNGIYWGLNQISHHYYKQLEPDALMALQIVVNPEYQGKEVSYECLNILKKIAYDQGLDKVVIPLRPSKKHLYPLIDIREYVGWKNDEGLPIDPWLRVHIKAGGKLVKQCKGITIQASIREWEEWTGLHFGATGKYIVSGALNPVYADIDKNLVTYSQENVWVVHSAK